MDTQILLLRFELLKMALQMCQNLPTGISQANVDSNFNFLVQVLQGTGTKEQETPQAKQAVSEEKVKKG